MKGSLGKPSVNCKNSQEKNKSGASWKPGATWILRALLELSVHCETAQAHGNMGTIVTQWNLTEASINFEHSTASWNPGEVELCHGSWKQGNIVTQQDLLEPRGTL